MSGNLDKNLDKTGNLQKFKVRTINIKVQDFIYQKLYEYKLLYRLDEIIINHLIDVIEEHEAKRNGRYKNSISDDSDDTNVPELEGMKEKKKF